DGAHRALHSFPTRRSSDLVGPPTPIVENFQTANARACARSPWLPPTRGFTTVALPAVNFARNRRSSAKRGGCSYSSSSPARSLRSEELTSELQSLAYLVCR